MDSSNFYIVLMTSDPPIQKLLVAYRLYWAILRAKKRSSLCTATLLISLKSQSEHSKVRFGSVTCPFSRLKKTGSSLQNFTLLRLLLDRAGSASKQAGSLNRMSISRLEDL